ncbi:MAG: mucoidy inhibitor MuiA family protein, partial [bacterium]|nr:mucoidy inhibitor MuiA family protein [bacterium]
MRYAATLFVLLCLTGTCTVYAGENQPTPVEAPIEKVTVYPGQAKVTRIAGLDLEAGEHSILIERLPSKVDAETFSVSAAGVKDALILGLRHKQVHHLESPREKAAELKREIMKLEREERDLLRDHLQAFEKQKNLLMALAGAAGKQMGEQVTQGALEVSQWEAAYDFVGRKHMQTDDSIRAARAQLNDIEVRRSQLVRQHRELEANQRLTSTSVTIDLRLERAGHVELALDYIISGATWIPIYDARLKPGSDSVEIGYYAEVIQTTGEDWEDVELTLSTALPSRGTGPGKLLGWFLSAPAPRRSMELDQTITVRGKSKIIDRYSSHQPVQTVDALLEQVAGVQTSSEGQVFIRGSRAGEVAYIVDGLPIDAPLGSLDAWSFNTAFRVRRKETILSDGQAVRTPIANYQLAASPRFICRPSNRKDAFRVMSLKNQDKAPLMPGKVSIFVGSSYIGKAALAGMILPREEFEIG